MSLFVVKRFVCNKKINILIIDSKVSHTDPMQGFEEPPKDLPRQTIEWTLYYKMQKTRVKYIKCFFKRFFCYTRNIFQNVCLVEGAQINF